MLKTVVLPVLVIVIVLGFFTGVSDLRGGTGDEDKRQLEESIRRVTAACYAAEGIYPPDIEYMKDHYGLQINEDKYIVYYEVDGSNLRPDFTVLNRTEQ